MRCTTSPKGYLHYGGNQVSYFKAYYYDDPTSSIPLVDRGLQYNWPGMMDTTATNLIPDSFVGRRGICPLGWHVPCDEEWDTLFDYVSSQSGFLCNGDSDYIAKALASTNYWNTDTATCTVGNDISANDATGFSAVPAGFFDYYLLAVVYTGEDAYFWSSTSHTGYDAFVRGIYRNWAKPKRGGTFKQDANSVRCVKD